MCPTCFSTKPTQKNGRNRFAFRLPFRVFPNVAAKRGNVGLEAETASPWMPFYGEFNSWIRRWL
jgi:hypothetical protein